MKTLKRALIKTLIGIPFYFGAYVLFSSIFLLNEFSSSIVLLISVGIGVWIADKIMYSKYFKSVFKIE